MGKVKFKEQKMEVVWSWGRGNTGYKVSQRNLSDGTVVDFGHGCNHMTTWVCQNPQKTA